MLRKIVVAAGLLTLGTLVGPQVSSAGPVSPAAGVTAADASTVQQVQYWRHRCGYWRRECADRWGWGGRNFYRCLRRHDCGGW